MTTTLQPPTRKLLLIGLWAAKALLAVAFVGIGLIKLTMPIPELASMMKWPGEYPSSFVRLIGLIDLLGGIGILLPSLTRVQPRLSTLAALGCSVLQVLAICFHVSRNEFQGLPLNVVLLALSLFVLWGRSVLAPLASQPSRSEPTSAADGRAR